MWNHRGQRRPEFAIEPGPGQESVWNYPRPPVAKPNNRLIEVRYGDVLLARSDRSYRILETASPPSVYVPSESVAWDQLVKVDGSSVCEWKGAAIYWALAGNAQLPVAWAYPRPRACFDFIRDFVSFYPGRVACFIDGERVQPQAGHFYGGWITSDIVGPFKGDPGTGHW